MSSRFQLPLLCVLACVTTNASDPPDAMLNPVNGEVEAVDLHVNDDYDVRHTLVDQRPPVVTNVSEHADDDFAPRIEIGPSGDTYVVWWRDSSTPGVFIRKRNFATGTWSAERRLSDDSEDSRNPSVVHDGTNAWVGFAVLDGLQTEITVNISVDEPDPIGSPTTIHSTEYSGNVDVEMNYKSGHLWITWIDSGSEVGWSEYDQTTGTWSDPAYEAWNEAIKVSMARSTIETTVLED